MFNSTSSDLNFYSVKAAVEEGIFSMEPGIVMVLSIWWFE